MQDIVSIIVTFYNGDKYLKRIKDYCESNNSNLLKINKRVELVLVNDNPEKKINSFCMGSISFDMMVINNQCNIGTHGSRIEGLKQCRGDYVIFLDQDDYISDIALFEMVSHISD